ncbi:protein CcmA, bactofilin family [Vreelandella subterranea]|uniref:Protein CcmA, bactofilin family n=1 Tax=Vreelandella subterranea TaxID=416874 RepID=A0A1H9UNT2_9GAMM|nr:polymer-forming cytoskeletal protein [Halomonas subterranea]SES10968.1 protein CcmA, bactofilin family [Halomonas subterranea]
MGIETWLILLSVAVMTLIIVDGRRKKLKKRAAKIDDASRVSARTDDAAAVDNARTLPALSDAFTPSEEPPRCDGDVSHEASSREGSYLGVATQVAGNIIANESVSIKGCVVGSVIARHQLIQLGASSLVSADLEGGHVCIDGHLDGDVHASERLTLMSSAKVHGAMSTNRFECHSGANLTGTVADCQATDR